MESGVRSIVLIVTICLQPVVGYRRLLPACDSNIYCNGSILHAVQTSRIFEDSKTFVDMSLKYPEETILLEFDKLQMEYDDKVPKENLTEFVHRYFAGPGDEFMPWVPSDLPRIPSFLNNITDPLLYDFAWDLCNIWKDLGRKIKPEVLKHPERYSLFYLPNPFIVPGGRFRETYYWDTYWVIKGLLVCQMNSTARGMLDNFVHLIETLGHIPNGGRVYYRKRSQPPLFIPMVYEYYKSTGDIDFLRDNIATLEKEYQFWVDNRSLNISKGDETYSLARYAVDMAAPRPESYAEDISVTAGLSQEDGLELYSNLVSACESGWDFSSRWYSRRRNDTTVEDLGLQATDTKDIIPVDLNSILCWNQKLLAEIFTVIGETAKTEYYTWRHRERRSAINTVLWNEEAGMWFDFSYSQNESRANFYASNIFPLFVGCGDMDDAKFKRQLSAVESYIKLPTSLLHTGQQWDFPNVWPPLQHVWIVGLTNTDSPALIDIAMTTAQTWIRSNHIGWERTRAMFEKYSAEDPGSRGAGGEYNVQEGFGWTNGVILDLVAMYGDRLTLSTDTRTCMSSNHVSSGVSKCTDSAFLWMITYFSVCLLKKTFK
ncbi:trehalase-like [Ylistrum balloti]|uniref:trehalase-like n=1 Tax=Ylistrum balloti TaxID=509963 RepID=UPI002905F30D|nr:trehalase-like [Ylistrum balloti]